MLCFRATEPAGVGATTLVSIGDMSRSVKHALEPGNHLPGPTVLRQERDVALPDLDYLRTAALVAIDDVRSVKAAQPCPVTRRATKCVVLARRYVGAD